MRLAVLFKMSSSEIMNKKKKTIRMNCKKSVIFPSGLILMWTFDEDRRGVRGPHHEIQPVSFPPFISFFRSALFHSFTGSWCDGGPPPPPLLTKHVSLLQVCDHVLSHAPSRGSKPESRRTQAASALRHSCVCFLPLLSPPLSPPTHFLPPILPLQWTCIAFGAAGSRWR